jgi:hypothetical protein
VGFRAAHIDAAALEDEPEREYKFAHASDCRDIRRGASDEHADDGVEHITESGEREQYAQQLRDIARPVDEVGQDKQTQAEEDEASVPEVGEGIDVVSAIRGIWSPVL